MINSKSIILGIAPGARQIGISVFGDEQLVFYAIKSFRKPEREGSLVNLRKVLRELLTKYKILAVAIEKVIFVQQCRTFVKIVYDEIKDFLKELKITFFEYNPKVMRAVICGLHKPTKHNMALLLSQKQPELARYFNVPRLWQKMYYAQLFDAVAVGLVCTIELKETAQLSPQSEEAA